MKKNIWLSGLALGCMMIAAAACKRGNGDILKDEDPNKVVGYIYTSTNGEQTNNVVRFSRHQDGTLTDEVAYSTNSLGGANVAAGGDAHGDFDAQGSVQIIGNYLLVVNAGGNQVSVFSLDRKTGDITFKTNTASGGTRPVSIAYTKKGSGNEYWVVVANQWNNPNVQKDGAMIERYPNDAFHTMDLTLPDATDMERNLTLFTFNAETGALSMVKQLDNYPRENGGPTTVSFSADGSRLATSTWGIAHFATMMPLLTEQHPSRVYVYNFSNGDVSGERYFEEAGIAGTIGFNWAPGSNNTMFVSNFNLIPAKLDNSVTVLNDNGTTVTKTANYGATNPNGINEACWTVLSPTGDKLYVASFASNLVSAFNVSGSSLSLAASAKRGGLAPMGDSKEVWVSPDGKYLYNTGAFQSFSINTFDLSGSNITYRSQTTLATTAASVSVAGKYNFLGLTGFDM